MTEAIGTLRDYQVLRWRQLAEKRLDHITELFTSGRWSLYYRESDFLDVIKQSKALVETWRKLAPPEPDARLPESPFSAVRDDAAVEQAEAEQPDAGSEPVSSVEVEVETEPDILELDAGMIIEAEVVEQPGAFHLESALATVAMQRLLEMPVSPFVDIRRSDAA